MMRSGGFAEDSPLASLRRDPARAQGALYDQLLRSKLSRREFMSLSLGAAAVSPIFGPVTRAAAGFDVARYDDGARITLDRIVLFEVSSKMFDGSPLVRCERHGDELSISVRGGWLAGTDMPADLDICARREGVGWDGRFTLAALGFDSRFPFEQWLLGHPVAHGKLALGPVLATTTARLQGVGEAIPAVLYPSWTFVINRRAPLALETQAGTVASTRTQIELLMPERSSLQPSDHHAPRTRMWFGGPLSNAKPARVDAATVCFANKTADVAVELHRDARSCRAAYLAIEASSADGAGRVIPGWPVADAQVEPGLGVRRLRMTDTGAPQPAVSAEFQSTQVWRGVGDARIEITAVGGDAAATAIDADSFVISRIVVPMADVDQAIFIRRNATPGGNWDSKVGCRTFEIPLDDFDLRLSRGADAFQMTLRFRHVHLRIKGPRSTLVQAPGRPHDEPPMIEFALGPQHVYEEALYSTEVGGNEKLPNTLTDEEICALNGQGTGPLCKTYMCDARREGRYEQVYRLAIDALRNQQPPQIHLDQARARFSEASWFTFKWSHGRRAEQKLPLTLGDLFDWQAKLRSGDPRFVELTHDQALPTSLSLAAQIALRGKPAHRPARIGETTAGSAQDCVSAIQAPYRLALAPIGARRWKIRGFDGRDASGRSEIWSLRAEALAMRAVWSPDFAPDDFWASNYSHTISPFRGSLDARDRHEIVALTSRFGEAALLGSANVVPTGSGSPEDPAGVFVPQPIQARIALLSSFGATLRLKGRWAPPASADAGGGALTVELWDQNSQIGRDNKVVVEYKGFLFPLGHPATLVKETERRLLYDPATGVVARLVQRFYIKVPALSRSVPVFQQPFEGRAWPFGEITMRAHVSADLEDPSTPCSPPPQPPGTMPCVQLSYLGLGQQAFWPRAASINGVVQDLIDFEFECALTGVKASAPQIFLDNSVVHTPDLLYQVILHYRNEVEAERRGGLLADWQNPSSYFSKLLEDGNDKPRKYIARVSSGKVRFAPESKPANTSHRVVRFLMDVDFPKPAADRKPKTDPKSCGQPIPAQDPTQTPLELEESNDFAAITGAVSIGVALESRNQPPFYPHLRQALVEPGSLSRLTNSSRQLALVELDGPYLRNGFDLKNAGEIYLRFANAGATLDFSSDTGNSGGFANATTRMSAVSRKRGPIGGAGEPLPQLPGYRIEAVTSKLAPAMMKAAAAGEADPVANARNDIADPREFFARSLGSAKLCGVVSFVDIIEVVMKASGARAPEILEEIESVLPLEIVREAAEILRKPLSDLLRPLSNQARPSIPPRLAAAVEAVIDLLERLARAPDGQVIALGTRLVKACELVRDEIRSAIEDPRTLLPPDALAWLTNVQALSRMLDRNVAQALVEQIRGEVVAAARAEALARADTLLAQHSDLRQIAQLVSDTKQSIEAIATAANGDPLDLLNTVQVEVTRAFRDLLELGAWNAWVDRTQIALDDQLKNYWSVVRIQLDAMQDDVSLLAAGVETEMVKLAATVETSLTAELGATTVDAAKVALYRRALVEVADFKLAAVAHAHGLEGTVEQLQSWDWRAGDEDNLERFQRAIQALRVAADALAKAPRLANLVSELGAAGVVVGATLVTQYREWIQRAAKEFLIQIFDGMLTHANTALSGALPPDIKSILTSYRNGVQDARTLVAGLNLTDLAKLTTLAQVDFVLGVLIEAPDPRGIAQRALAQVRVAARADMVDRLSRACGSISSLMATLRDGVARVVDDLNIHTDMRRWLAPSLMQRLDDLGVSLGAAATAPSAREGDVKTYLVKTLRDVVADFKQLVQEIGEAAQGGDVSSLLNVREAVNTALDRFGLPTHAKLSYDWQTEVRPYPGGSGAIFEPIGGKGKLSIVSRAVIDLRGASRPQVAIEANLDKFKINLFGSAPFLSILFKPLKFTAGTGQKSHLVADVDSVAFGSSLSFVKSLQRFLKEKFGILVEPWTEGPGIVVGYEFYRDQVTATAFVLQNVGFSISCILPFNSQPAKFRFSLSRPDKPFLVSAGIYGGGGFVGIQSRADTIEYLESSFEYGLVTAFKFGVAKGSGRITAGIYIRIGKRTAVLSGFFNASGNADIAGLIRVSANFRVQFAYDGKTGKVYGSATFSISFSIGFLDFSFNVGVAYARKGDREDSGQQSSDSRSFEKRASTNRIEGAVSKELKQRGFGALEQRRSEQAEDIEDDACLDLSDRMLKPSAWASYWDAFEEPLDECA